MADHQLKEGGESSDMSPVELLVDFLLVCLLWFFALMIRAFTYFHRVIDTVLADRIKSRGQPVVTSDSHPLFRACSSSSNCFVACDSLSATTQFPVAAGASRTNLGLVRKFYAVRLGRVPGIYNTWEDCRAQVHCFKGAEFKGFRTLSEAELYLVQFKP
jgi:hypothetical protein